MSRPRALFSPTFVIPVRSAIALPSTAKSGV
jgi:hypothetical protein